MPAKTDFECLEGAVICYTERPFFGLKMNTSFVYTVYMKKRRFTQTTICNILERGECILKKRPVGSRRDFSFIIGSITHEEADCIEQVVQHQRQIDKRIWK